MIRVHVNTHLKYIEHKQNYLELIHEIRPVLLCSWAETDLKEYVRA